MDFTFGICTYNSGAFVTETLESVRYQMLHYGSDVRATLIVSDDASDDDTLVRVESWIERYKGMFSRTLVLTHDTNSGIAHNYARLLRHIDTPYFKTIDGDDIISSNNIFEQVTGASDGDMNIYATVHMRDGKVCIFDGDCEEVYYYAHQRRSHRQDVQLFETYKPFSTVSVVLRRKFFTEECLAMVEEYTQFEDDTSLYSILKANPDMAMKYHEQVMIIHRLHGTSLSSGEMSVQQIKFLDDLHRLKKYMMRQEHDVRTAFIVFLNLIETFLMKHRFGITYSPYKKLNAARRKKIIKRVGNKRGCVEYKRRVEDEIRKQEEFAHEIAAEAAKFEEIYDSKN